LLQVACKGAESELKDYFLNRLTTWLWSFIVLVIVLLAMYTSFGRLLTNNLARYQGEILQELNGRISFVLEVDSLKGSWDSLTPTIELNGVRVLGDEHAPIGFEINSLRADIDVLGSLFNRTVQLYVLNASGVRMHVDVAEDGQLSLAGIPGGGGAVGSPLYDFVFNAEHMSLEEIAIHLHDDTGLREIQVETRLEREEEFRRFSMSLLSPSRNSWFRMVAEGDGELTDLSKFEGRFHLDSSVNNLDFFADLLEQSGLAPGRGTLNTELWLALEKGKVRLAANVDARDFELQSIDEEQPDIDFDQLSATLRANFSDDTWTFGASDFLLSRAEQSLALDRLSGEYANNGLLLRTEDIEIARYVAYLDQAGLLPEAIDSILDELSPRGRLVKTELHLPDLEDLSRWRLASEFDQLTVDPWRAAPGVENASGYVSMGAREGVVQLDSSEFSMDFPVIYDRALSYSEFNAELRWQVHEELFHLSSGPFRARAEEGAVNGLFALRLPLAKTEVGPEMDLVIGLRDSDPVHREKYLPRTLSPKLLDWLGPSIGNGRIKEGAFIYRGALGKHLPQHRTVQLFFDTDDVELEYHADWPPVSALDGLVIIDDADVDVHATEARLFDSEARDIEMRLRTDADKHLQLALSALILGSAADGLAVINTSPLRKVVGDSFADWQLQGDLRTELELALDLTDLSLPPQVDVVTHWDNVEIDTGPLGVTLERVSGRLHYDSENGFSAEGIQGVLWGEPVIGDVSQGRRDGGLATLDVALLSRVSTQSLRDWLRLDLLRLAEGSSDIELHILVPPGEGARLVLSSELEGVSLDLPKPWGKSALEQRNLELAMPLGPLPRRLMLNLERQVYLGVLMEEEGYDGISLGFGSPLEAEERGFVLVGGQVDKVNWDEWFAFSERYLFPQEGQPAVDVRLGVRQLRIGEAEIFGWHFDDVLVDAQQLDTSWKIDFKTDWAQGGLLLPDDLESANVSFSYLDLAGATASLEGQQYEVGSGGDELPRLTVSIDELREDTEVWGNLQFLLVDEGQDYHFRNIRGNLRGLQLGDDEKAMELQWLASGEEARTKLVGALEFGNFGEVLQAYQVDEVVETSEGRVDLDLSWPGAPTDFSLAETSGRMGVNVGEGRFLKTSDAAAGTLRVVGILNLAEFVRRLSLDLSYIFKSGVPFDSIEGELHFLQGLVDVPQMDVLGRTSRFQFVGQANIPESSIDGELVATLPIASNLPWMFALVSGLPTAAAVYVISKLFNKQMDRFSSAIYTVQGPWADPEVSFQRIFDNTADQSVTQTAESEIEMMEEDPDT
jgi:uncharacterized protein (TIGR02099 family)